MRTNNNITATANTEATRIYSFLRDLSEGKATYAKADKSKIKQVTTESEQRALTYLRKLSQQATVLTNCESVPEELETIYNIIVNLGYTVNCDGRKKKLTVKCRNNLFFKVYAQKNIYKVSVRDRALFADNADVTTTEKKNSLPYSMRMNENELEAFVNTATYRAV